MARVILKGLQADSPTLCDPLAQSHVIAALITSKRLIRTGAAVYENLSCLGVRYVIILGIWCACMRPTLMCLPFEYLQ